VRWFSHDAYTGVAGVEEEERRERFERRRWVAIIDSKSEDEK
jgi:hypothetical protein